MSMIKVIKKFWFAIHKTASTKAKSSILVRSSMPRTGKAGRTNKSHCGLVYGVVRTVK